MSSSKSDKIENPDTQKEVAPVPETNVIAPVNEPVIEPVIEPK
jgi:hypothetical protein